jgi:hypothetical protein
MSPYVRSRSLQLVIDLAWLVLRLVPEKRVSQKAQTELKLLGSQMLPVAVMLEGSIPPLLHIDRTLDSSPFLGGIHSSRI